MGDRDQWLLFLPQTPSSPSSLRVTVWRRMREAGAVHLGSGVWALPYGAEQERIVRGLLSDIRPDGGHGLLFLAHALGQEERSAIQERGAADREREYAEFRERAAAFLAEIAKETERQKFDFAELEETEQDLQRLTQWLEKIQARDHFGRHMAAETNTLLVECQHAFQAFAHAVYQRQGLPQEGGDDGS